MPALTIPIGQVPPTSRPCLGRRPATGSSSTAMPMATLRTARTATLASTTAYRPHMAWRGLAIHNPPLRPTPRTSITQVLVLRLAYGGTDTGTGSMAYYWDGTSWSRGSIAAARVLKGVAMVSPNEAWAVESGGNKIWHWTGPGLTWTPFSAPALAGDIALQAIS